MRLILAALVLVILMGCPIVYKGVIKNDTVASMSVIYPWSEEFEGINAGAEKRVHLFFPSCIEVLANGESRYFQAPHRTDGPEDAFDNKMFAVHVALQYSNAGLFFASPSQGLVKLNEVDSCDHK